MTHCWFPVKVLFLAYSQPPTHCALTWQRGGGGRGTGKGGRREGGRRERGREVGWSLVSLLLRAPIPS